MSREADKPSRDGGGGLERVAGSYAAFFAGLRLPRPRAMR
jgi:hypothetical protein